MISKFKNQLRATEAQHWQKTLSTTSLNLKLTGFYKKMYLRYYKSRIQLDGSLPANPVNDRRKANAVTLKRTFCLP